ncbi:MAG TPA: TetR/AcrR family transcriptional regulator [Firmicutes bacterium]|nr:TetR/AcrR family transcriptional regulator [Bacillota bacterium]
MSRPTFYLHYSSKEDLLFDYYEDIAQKTEKKFNKLRKKETMDIFFSNFNQKMFEEHLKNRVVMEAIFEAKLESMLIKRLYGRWADLFKDLLSSYETSISESAMRILVSFFLGGFIEFLKMFFAAENPPSIEQLARFHYKLMNSYIKNIMLEASPYIDFSL